MNKARRALLAAISNQLRDQLIELEGVIDDEQEAFDNIPDSLKESERGQTACEGLDELNEARSDLENLIEKIAEYL